MKVKTKFTERVFVFKILKHFFKFGLKERIFLIVGRPSRQLIKKARLHDFWLLMEGGRLNNFGSYLTGH